MRLLALVPGAYGDSGGIAQYNRDLFLAISTLPWSKEIVVLPRHANARIGSTLPPGITQPPMPTSRLAYTARAIDVVCRNQGFDVVFCGHINLACVAAVAASLASAKLWLQVHGLEAWTRPPALVRHALRRSDLVTSVSRFTRSEVLRNWWHADPLKIKVLPNTLSSRFTHGPKSARLLDRYQLHGRRIVLTVSRLSASEAYKGHDRVISVMRRIMDHIPNLAYLIVGDGDGHGQLRALVQELGLEHHVVFAGHVDECDLVEHYRTADVFVMPSTKEGFGIVFLEAAACGLPVVGGQIDGSWDALKEGRLGLAVDPNCDDEIVGAIVQALTAQQQPRARELDDFRHHHFQSHVDGLLRDLLKPLVDHSRHDERR